MVVIFLEKLIVHHDIVSSRTGLLVKQFFRYVFSKTHQFDFVLLLSTWNSVLIFEGIQGNVMTILKRILELFSCVGNVVRE